METREFGSLSRSFANGFPRRVVLKILAVACLYGFFCFIFGIGEARAAQSCVVSDIQACIKTADDTLESELADCNEVPNPGPCRVAARRRHDAAVKACDPCPRGTRCESNVCCPNDQNTCTPPCSITKTTEGSVLQSTVTGSVRGQSLSVTTTQRIPSRILRNALGRTTFIPNGSLASGTTEIVLGGEQLAKIDFSSSSDSTRVQVRYGLAFRGIKSATFTVQGDTVQGVIDGRPVIPFARGTDPSLMKFADGNPPPTIEIDPDIWQAIEATLKQSQKILSVCPSGPAIFPGELPGCIACEDTCSKTAMLCFGSTEAGCTFSLFFAGACEALAGFLCQENYDNCHQGCEKPGAPCCPVPCNGGCCDTGLTCCPNALRGLQCCGSGTRCASDNTENGICCTQDSGPLCGNRCCPSGQDCLGGTKGICCPTGMRLCGDTCCSPDAACINNSVCCGSNTKICGGTCCPKDAPCINDFCCQSPSHVCAGKCCAPFDVCCNNACCGGNNLCIDNEICCPRDQVCGHICCPAGQHCVNGACAVCPGDTIPCRSPGPDGVVISICCPPGANCCLGKCCTKQTGHECVGPGGACGTLH